MKTSSFKKKPGQGQLKRPTYDVTRTDLAGWDIVGKCQTGNRGAQPGAIAGAARKTRWDANHRQILHISQTFEK